MTRNDAYDALAGRLSGLRLRDRDVTIDRKWVTAADALSNTALLPRICIMPDTEQHTRQAPSYPVHVDLFGHLYLYALVVPGEMAGETIHELLDLIGGRLTPTSPFNPLPVDGWGLSGLVDVAPVIDGSQMTAAIAAVAYRMP